MAVPSLAERGRRGATWAHSGPGVGPLAMLGVILASPAGMAMMLDGSGYDTWGAFIWGPVLLLLTLPLCRWVASRTNEPEIAGFLFGAAALKIIVGSTLRYYMVDAVYGAGDSVGYDNAAAELVGPFRQGVFENLGKVTGTRFLEIVNGIVQAMIGQTMVGSFLVFSALAFVGLCFLYLAFCEALPDGDRTLYRRLLFLTPTLWFWPSSVGKEAFLMLCIGAMAYGFARLLNGRFMGVIFAGLGLWGAAVVRPHIALMFLVGAVVALPPPLAGGPARANALPRSARTSFARFMLPLLVLVALPSSLGAAETFFHIEGLNLESATEVRDEVVRRTSSGGSEFVAPDTSNPLGLAAGLVTVVVRPFPWEATEFQVLSSAEGVVLSVVVIAALWRRRGRILRSLGQRWPRLAGAYVLAFAWGFSAVSNFGILARQRSLMLPMLFVIVAAVRRPAAAGRDRALAPQPSTRTT